MGSLKGEALFLKVFVGGFYVDDVILDIGLEKALPSCAILGRLCRIFFRQTPNRSPGEHG